MDSIYQQALLAHHKSPCGFIATTDDDYLEELVQQIKDSADNACIHHGAKAQLPINDKLQSLCHKAGFSPNASSYGSNLSCGDEIAIILQIANDENVSTLARKIIGVGFAGDSCAICRASASMLVTSVKGLSIAEVLNISGYSFELLQTEMSLKNHVTLRDLTTNTQDVTNNNCIHFEQFGQLEQLAQEKRDLLKPLTSVIQFPVRIQCGILPWLTFIEALEYYAAILQTQSIK